MSEDTELDVQVNIVISFLSSFQKKRMVRLGKRVGNRFQDIAILANYCGDNEEKRTICCIEVKKITTSGITNVFKKGMSSKLFETSVHQALAYGKSNSYIRHGILVFPSCILTDGEYYCFLDPEKTVEQNIDTILGDKYTWIFPNNSEVIGEVFKSIENYFVEDFLQYKTVSSHLFPKVQQAKKSPNTCDVHLSKDILKTHQVFVNAKLSKELCIDFTMQCFLLAVLRNCGFISITEIDKKISDTIDHKWLKNTLNHWFGVNFEEVSDKHFLTFGEAYITTRKYSVRIDAMPQIELGYAYEAFIQKIKHSKSTEFYTPIELVVATLDELDLNIDDSVFDPACGCGSFLIEIIKKHFPEPVKTEKEIGQLTKYIENNIFGNDIDIYATCIAKSAVLSVFVEKTGIDPHSSSIALPSIKGNFYCENYFLFTWKLKNKPKVVVSNAPWGQISSDCENFDKLVRTQEVWQTISKIRHKKLLPDSILPESHDISGTFCLKIIDDFANTPKFKMGVLVKQQIIAKNKDSFVCDPRVKSCYFFDYGSLQLFRNTGSLTAICFFNENKKQEKIIRKYNNSFLDFSSVSTKTLSCLITKGPDIGRNGIWLDITDNTELSDLTVKIIDRTESLLPFRHVVSNIVYIAPPNSKLKKDFNYIQRYNQIENCLSPNQKCELKKVTTGAKKANKKTGTQTKIKKNKNFPYTWRRPLRPELLADNKIKVIIPFQFTGVTEHSRLPVTVVKEKIAIRDSHIAFIFEYTQEKEAYSLAAWMSSKLFVKYLDFLASKNEIKRLSGNGFELNPKYAINLKKIPDNVLISDLWLYLKKNIGFITQENLEVIDSSVSELLLKNVI